MRRQTEQGFTLVELLVALSLASFVLTIIISAIGYCRSISESIDGNGRMFDQLALLDRVLSPAFVTIVGQEFHATRRQASLTTVAPAVLASALSIVRMTVGPTPTGSGLQARWQFDGDPRLDRSHKLLESPLIVWFSYLNIDGQWLSDWTDQATIPVLVRLELQDADTGKRHGQFDFVVRTVKHPDCVANPRAVVCGAP